MGDRAWALLPGMSIDIVRMGLTGQHHAALDIASVYKIEASAQARRVISIGLPPIW